MDLQGILRLSIGESDPQAIICEAQLSPLVREQTE